LTIHKPAKTLQSDKMQKFMTQSLTALLIIGLLSVQLTVGGPALGALCNAGCASVQCACYTAAGLTFGTVAALGAPSSILGCNAGFGKCMTACSSVWAAWTP
jgi:hypothetical protein